MNIKTIIGFGFRIISRIMEISEISAKSASADNTLLDLHNSLDDAQPHPIIVRIIQELQLSSIRSKS